MCIPSNPWCAEGVFAPSQKKCKIVIVGVCMHSLGAMKWNLWNLWNATMKSSKMLQTSLDLQLFTNGPPILWGLNNVIGQVRFRVSAVRRRTPLQGQRYLRPGQNSDVFFRYTGRFPSFGSHSDHSVSVCRRVPSLDHVISDTPCWLGTFASVLPTRTKRSSRACRCALRVARTLSEKTELHLCCRLLPLQHT